MKNEQPNKEQEMTDNLQREIKQHEDVAGMLKNDLAAIKGGKPDITFTNEELKVIVFNLSDRVEQLETLVLALTEKTKRLENRINAVEL